MARPPSWRQRRAPTRLRLAGAVLLPPVLLVALAVGAWTAGTLGQVLGYVAAGGMLWAVARRAAGNHLIGRRPRAGLDGLYAALVLAVTRPRPPPVPRSIPRCTGRSGRPWW